MNMNNIFRKIINESFYGKKDIDDHKFEYLRNVLDKLENNNTISLKTKGNKKGVRTEIQHLKTEEFKKNITRFKNWLNNEEDITDDNRLSNKIKFSKDEYSIDKRDTLLDAFNTFFGNENSPLKKWTDIEKTDYSIIRTPEQEGIQAIFLAARIKGDKDFYDILDSNLNWDDKCYAFKEKFYENNLGITLTNDEIDFSNLYNKDVLKKLVNILKINELPQEFKNLTEFTIIHPDGLNNNVNVDFAKVLFGEGIKWEKIFMGQPYTDSISKDAFIPADIYIVPLNKDKIEKLDTIIKAEKGKFSPDSMVGLSNKLMGNKEKNNEGKNINVPLIFPISLKMSSKIPIIHKIENSKKENFIHVGINNITKIHFNPTGNSTVEIKCGDKDILVLEFRSKGRNEKTGKHQPWQCNAMNKFNKDAIEGGSAKDYMKLVFNDSMEDSITEEEAEKIAEVFGDKIIIDEKLNKILKQKTSSEDEITFAKTEESILAESFRRFFEDNNVEENEDDKKEKSTLTVKDMVLLAVPGTEGRGESSAKEGNIGLGLFCKNLIDKKIKNSGNNNEALSKIVQLSYKLSEYVQDTWKIM